MDTYHQIEEKGDPRCIIFNISTFNKIIYPNFISGEPTTVETIWSLHSWFAIEPAFILSPEAATQLGDPSLLSLLHRVGCLLLLLMLEEYLDADTSWPCCLNIFGRDVLDRLSALSARRSPNDILEQECLLLLLEVVVQSEENGSQLSEENIAQTSRVLRQIFLEQQGDSMTTSTYVRPYLDPLLLVANDDDLRHDVSSTDSQDKTLRSPASILLSEGISSEANLQLTEVLNQSPIRPPVPLPFQRPPPVPLLPLRGYGDDSLTSVTEDEATLYTEHMHGELIWMTPCNLRLMLLPDDEEDDKEAAETYHKVLELMNQALTKPLAPEGQRLVLQFIQQDQDEQDYDDEEDQQHLFHPYKLILESHLQPTNLPKLVEHNPLIAYECLARIILVTTKNSHQLQEQNEYASALVSMEVGIHSMEVVNRLAIQKSLHSEYIHLFISSCIASCQNIARNNQSSENGIVAAGSNRSSKVEPNNINAGNHRLVRLVCIFIQSLWKNDLVSKKDIFYEVQSFCVEFSRFREATNLYKLLKEK